jgi:hypothetical protein
MQISPASLQVTLEVLKNNSKDFHISNPAYIPKGTQVSFFTKMLHTNIEQCSTMGFRLLLSAIEFLHLKKYMMGEYMSSRIIMAESLNIYFERPSF